MSVIVMLTMALLMNGDLLSEIGDLCDVMNTLT